MNFFKSKFFIIVLCVALVLTIIPSVWAMMGRTDLARGAINIAASPFRWCFNGISGAVRGFAAYFTEFDRISAENEALRELLKDYEAQKDRNEYLEQENNWLKNYLELKDDYNEFSFAEATVISREAGSSTQLFTLNRGSLHGVEVGMPVVTERGVVGFVSEVGITSSKVTGLLDASASAGALVERSSEVGVLEGSFELRADGRCKLSYLEKNADVKVGDLIVTSGVGGVYPEGLRLGRVVGISHDPYDRSTYATVEPSVDFDNLNRVMIITETKRAEG